jgi:hypothetical protein
MSMQTKPSVVFYHGIWADGSRFNKVIPPLQSERFEVIASSRPRHHEGDVDRSRFARKAFAFEIKQSEWIGTNCKGEWS